MRKPKTIITFLLLAFVAVSLGYAVMKERGINEKPGSQDSRVSKETKKIETQSTSESRKLESKVVAYYFHGNTRCVTCRNIESYAKEAVESGFPEAVKKGRLEFKVVNVEEPQNEHFVREYQLSTRSVVLARFERGKQNEWKNLQLVWELVRDHDAFVIYVQEETKSLLGEGS